MSRLLNRNYRPNIILKLGSHINVCQNVFDADPLRPFLVMLNVCVMIISFSVMLQHFLS